MEPNSLRQFCVLQCAVYQMAYDTSEREAFIRNVHYLESRSIRSHYLPSSIPHYTPEDKLGLQSHLGYEI